MSLSVDVHKTLGDFSLDVSFEVDDARETLALLGPSGCGKSLTLKCVAGVLTPDEGHIELNGRTLFDSAARINLPPQQRHVGYLFQQYALFPTMTVEQNIAAGAVGVPRQERARRVAEQVRTFRLEGLERLRPAQLSGGQQQRVALARILAGEPELIMLDEPFSALDGYLRWELEMELSDTLRRFPGGALFVSHNRDEAYRMCDTVCVISHGRSEPKLTISELFSTPRTLSAALISGCKNVSRARVVTGEQDAGEKVADSGRAADAEVTPSFTDLFCEDWGVTLKTELPVGPGVTHVGLRAHYLRVFAGPALADDASNQIPCTVERVIDSTFSTIVMLATPGGGLLRYECEKDAWDELAGARELVVVADPAIVMPLEGGEEGEQPEHNES